MYISSGKTKRPKSGERTDAQGRPEHSIGASVAPPDSQPDKRCSCGHPTQSHINGKGPCHALDGKQFCSCGGFSKWRANSNPAIPAAQHGSARP